MMPLFRFIAVVFFLPFLFSATVFAETPMQIVLPRTETAQKAFKIEKIRNDLWTVTTEHYEIITRHSAEAGEKTGQYLEHLENVWHQLFHDTLRPSPPKKSSAVFPRLRVFLYKDKEDYVQNLKQSEPGIEPMLRESHGFYQLWRRTAYFYPVSPNMDKATADSVHKTLYHEGTHQLFQETGRNTKLFPGVRNNFWLVEGIAMLMETLKIDGEQYTVGDPDDNRLYAAKVHRFDKEYYFYVPFNKLVKMGKNTFQSQPKLARLYSQSAGMTHFLMFYDGGKYRPAMLELLRLIYTGAAQAESLSELTNQSYEELDKQYEEFLKEL